MIKNIYNKVANCVSNYLGRIFLALLVLAIGSSFVSANALNTVYKDQRQIEGIAQLISIRLYYGEETDKWDEYLEDYKNNNKALYTDEGFVEIIDLISDPDNFSGEDSRINQLQAEVFGKVSRDSKFAILSGAVSQILELSAAIVGVVLLVKMLLKHLTKKQMFRKDIVDNWEEDFIDNGIQE